MYQASLDEKEKDQNEPGLGVSPVSPSPKPNPVQDKEYIYQPLDPSLLAKNYLSILPERFIKDLNNKFVEQKKPLDTSFFVNLKNDVAKLMQLNFDATFVKDALDEVTSSQNFLEAESHLRKVMLQNKLKNQEDKIKESFSQLHSVKSSTETQALQEMFFKLLQETHEKVLEEFEENEKRFAKAYGTWQLTQEMGQVSAASKPDRNAPILADQLQKPSGKYKSINIIESANKDGEILYENIRGDDHNSWMDLVEAVRKQGHTKAKIDFSDAVKDLPPEHRENIKEAYQAALLCGQGIPRRYLASETLGFTKSIVKLKNDFVSFVTRKNETKLGSNSDQKACSKIFTQDTKAHHDLLAAMDAVQAIADDKVEELKEAQNNFLQALEAVVGEKYMMGTLGMLRETIGNRKTHGVTEFETSDKAAFLGKGDALAQRATVLLSKLDAFYEKFEKHPNLKWADMMRVANTPNKDYRLAAGPQMKPGGGGA